MKKILFLMILVLLFSTSLVFADSYQTWASYPNSPVNTATYPYQAIGTDGYDYYLIYSSQPMWSSGGFSWTSNGSGGVYILSAGGTSWTSFISQQTLQANLGLNSVKEANEDVFTTSAKTSVFFQGPVTVPKVTKIQLNQLQSLVQNQTVILVGVGILLISLMLSLVLLPRLWNFL